MEDPNLRDLQEERNILESLIAHPGFKRYLEILEGQKEEYRKINRTPLMTYDDGLAKNYAIGKLEALQTAIDTVQTQVDELTREIDEREKIIRE